MKAVLSILLILLFHTEIVVSQTVKLAWANGMHGNSFDACRAIAVDDESNVYTAGYYSTTVDFDPGPAVYNLTSANAEDIFLAKYDSTGKMIWAKSIGDFRYQAIYTMTLDANKNIIIAGIYFGTTDFDPGIGEAKLSSNGNEDIFVCKYDNAGNFIWASSFGGPTNEFCNSIVTDNQNNIYFNGYYEDTADFDPGPGVYKLRAAGATDIFVCKISSFGNLVWVKSIGGLSSDAAFSIGLDEFNNVYSTGFFWQTVDFDPGAGTFNLTSDAFGDGFLLKLSNAGDFISAGKMGGNSRVRCSSLEIDKTNHIYITGHFDGDADFDMGPGISLLSSPIDDDDIFVAKYDPDFALVWLKQIGGPSFQKVFDLEFDQAENIYITGHYNGTADFDPGPAEQILTAVDDPDVFVLKLNPSGEFVWVAAATGPFYGSGYSMKVDPQNNIYVGGTFEGTIDFDPGPDEYKISSAGESEIFLLKLRQCFEAALTETRNINTCTSYTLFNKVYDSSGNYTQYVLNSFGCDSLIITLNLFISRAVSSINADVCEGERYFAGGAFQTQTGIYFDTLKTNAGCDSVLITHLTIWEKPKPNLGKDRNICVGETILLSPGNFSSYLWQDQSTAPQYLVSKPGSYFVTVTNQFNCSASKRVTIHDFTPVPAGFLPADKELCTGNLLKIQVPGYKSYAWSNGAVTPDLEIKNGGNYYLTVTNFDNCAGTDSLFITEINCIPVSIPNAFSPNNDGLNDLFKPSIQVEISNFQMNVYNRNGQTIFSTKDPKKGWDGRFKGQLQSSSNYIYQISFVNAAGKLLTYSGNILLLR